MKRVAAILAFLLVAGLAFFVFAPVEVSDGWYDLTVEIDADCAAGVSLVSYLPADNRDMADAIVATVDNQFRFMEHQDTVEPFTVNVGFSLRASKFGLTWGHRQQYSHLIVVLHRDDGSRVLHRLAIPHRDDSRKIIVTVASAT